MAGTHVTDLQAVYRRRPVSLPLNQPKRIVLAGFDGVTPLSQSSLNPTPAPPVHTRFLKKHRLAVQGMLLGSALVIAAVCAYVNLQSVWQTATTNKATPTTKGATAPSALAAETENDIDESPQPKNAVASYKVASDLPRTLSIPSIGVSARILSINTNKTGSLEVPRSIYDAGWYKHSGKPGDAAAMLLDGHYAGPSYPAVFHHLDRLKNGAIIEIERGDGRKLRYKVTRTAKMPANKVDMASLLVSTPGAQKLNLISCAGTYNPQTKTYDQRFIVSAIAQ